MLTKKEWDAQCLTSAKNLIRDYCRREFEDDKKVDFSDLSKIPVAYTTTEDEKHEIQAYINLVDFRVETFVDDKCVQIEQYDSLEEMVEDALPSLCFDDLVCVSEEDLNFTGPTIDEIIKDATVRSKAGSESDIEKLIDGF